MNKSSEALDSARSEYIEGYEEKNKLIFPTLAFVAKEFNVSFSTLRRKAANEGWLKKRKHRQNSEKSLKCESNSRENFQNSPRFQETRMSLSSIFKRS